MVDQIGVGTAVCNSGEGISVVVWCSGAVCKKVVPSEGARYIVHMGVVRRTRGMNMSEHPVVGSGSRQVLEGDVDIREKSLAALEVNVVVRPREVSGERRAGVGSECHRPQLKLPVLPLTCGYVETDDVPIGGVREVNVCQIIDIGSPTASPGDNGPLESCTVPTNILPAIDDHRLKVIELGVVP